MLGAFAERHAIGYPLLSDEDSRVIRELGLYNEHLAEQAAAYGLEAREHQHGVPYPGIFMLDERGIVVDRQFEQSYRVRPTAVALVEQLGGEPVTAVTASASKEPVSVVASLTTSTYRPYQKLALHVRLRVAPDVHIYGEPIPEDYVPLTIEIEPVEGLIVEPVRLPEPRPFRVEGLDEEFVVYEDDVEAVVPFELTKNLGTVTLEVVVRYQACDDRVCFPPDAVRLPLPIEGADLIRD